MDYVPNEPLYRNLMQLTSEHIPNWPEERLRPLMERFGEMLMEQRIYRGIFGVI